MAGAPESPTTCSISPRIVPGAPSTAGLRQRGDALQPRSRRGRRDRANDAGRFPGEGRTSFSLPDLPARPDYFGVNYYSRVHLRFRGVLGPFGEFFYRDREGRGLTDTGWEIHPRGFDRVLRLAASAGLPILVTENGIATEDDRLRRSFLHEHALIPRTISPRGPGSRVFLLVAPRQLRVAGGIPAALRSLRGGLCDLRAPPAPVGRSLRGAGTRIHR